MPRDVIWAHYYHHNIVKIMMLLFNNLFSNYLIITPINRPQKPAKSIESLIHDRRYFEYRLGILCRENDGTIFISILAKE